MYMYDTYIRTCIDLIWVLVYFIACMYMYVYMIYVPDSVAILCLCCFNYYFKLHFTHEMRYTYHISEGSTYSCCFYLTQYVGG